MPSNLKFLTQLAKKSFFSSMRGISVVAPTQNAHFLRVIGTTDFLGQGTKHTVAEINPFILMDDAPIARKAGVPPFGVHPHHGLQVVSLIWSGVIHSRFAHELSPTFCHGPVAVSLFAGRGMAHEEFTATDDAMQMQQLIFRVKEESRTKHCWSKVGFVLLLAVFVCAAQLDSRFQSQSSRKSARVLRLLWRSDPCLDRTQKFQLMFARM